MYPLMPRFNDHMKIRYYTECQIKVQQYLANGRFVYNHAIRKTGKETPYTRMNQDFLILVQLIPRLLRCTDKRY
jgi:hypothetical protein